MTRAERRSAAGLGAAVLALHLLGFGVLLLVVAPAGLHGLTVGVGLTAYALGLRHAFDADHIAAIDNTTRRLLSADRRPLSVGFFFSLGHSTVVLALTILLAAGVHALGGAVADESSTLQQATGLVGTLVSGTFLCLIGALNLASLAGMMRAARRGEVAPPEGAMSRIYARFTRAVREPWHMYPLGFLFGLGFDTASEIALLVLAAGASFSGLPFYAILCLPVLFAAGMSLLDTLDGAFMSRAYGWAMAAPARRLYYNATVTTLSVAVALGIGTIELMSVLVERLGLHGAVWRWIAGIDVGMLGYGVTALFALTWIVAAAVWRIGRIEQRWARMQSI
jgi:high-affinity nickel-transport protein